MSVNLAVLATGGTAPELIRKHNAFVEKLKDTQEERGMDDTIGGVRFQTRPSYTDRKHERADVFCDGWLVASEWTSIPWNVFKAITTSYWVFVDRPTRSDCLELLQAARIPPQRLKGEPGATVTQDPYAEPPRYHVWVDEPEEVVRLYKEMVRRKLITNDKYERHI